MAKKSRKLSLKKETLRQIDEKDLGQVAGGTYYFSDAVMLKQPSKTFSGGCTGDGLAVFNYYNLYYYY
jgi:hypothetical protein